MADALLEAYVATMRPDARDTVRALAAAIDAADAGLDRKMTYRMLVYTFGQRWHHWVVAIGVSTKVVNLRFLYGRQLDDPAGLLRPGSTTAAVIDYKTAEDIDPALVSACVREAAARHPRSSAKAARPQSARQQPAERKSGRPAEDRRG